MRNVLPKNHLYQSRQEWVVVSGSDAPLPYN